VFRFFFLARCIMLQFVALCLPQTHFTGVNKITIILFSEQFFVFFSNQKRSLLIFCPFDCQTTPPCGYRFLETKNSFFGCEIYLHTLCIFTKNMTSFPFPFLNKKQNSALPFGLWRRNWPYQTSRWVSNLGPHSR